MKLIKDVPTSTNMTDRPKPLSFEILNPDSRIIRAWASVEEKDLEGDLITMEAFRKTMLDFMDTGANVMFQHTNHPIGKVLNYEFKKHEQSGKPGLFMTIKLYDKYELHDRVWEGIKKGDYTGISFGGFGKDASQKFVGGEAVNIIPKTEGFEFSIVERPANPLALIEEVNYVAKSYKGEEINKPNPHIPGGSFNACVQKMKENGHDEESATKICGRLKADREKNKAYPIAEPNADEIKEIQRLINERQIDNMTDRQMWIANEYDLWKSEKMKEKNKLFGFGGKSVKDKLWDIFKKYEGARDNWNAKRRHLKDLERNIPSGADYAHLKRVVSALQSAIKDFTSKEFPSAEKIRTQRSVESDLRNELARIPEGEKNKQDNEYGDKMPEEVMQKLAEMESKLDAILESVSATPEPEMVEESKQEDESPKEEDEVEKQDIIGEEEVETEAVAEVGEKPPAVEAPETAPLSAEAPGEPVKDEVKELVAKEIKKHLASFRTSKTPRSGSVRGYDANASGDNTIVKEMKKLLRHK